MTNFPMSDRALNAGVLERINDANKARNGGQDSYLLPLAFPEGSPTHPAYGAGHATVAGACVTILKAFSMRRPRSPIPSVSATMGSASRTIPATLID
jgi:hypothetical protein